MFTDGLDPSALQWVREGLEQKERAVSSMNVETRSPRLVRENLLVGRRKGKNAWGLPPTQLPNAHFHSGLLRPQFSSAGIDDSSESIGSASADNQDYEDSTDSEEHESGRYSLDSSPQSHFVGKINHAESTGNGNTTSCGAADDYYYEYDRRLLSSRSNSKSNSRSNSRRESFGRLDCRQAQALQKGKDSLPYGYGAGDKDDQKCFYDKGQYSDGDSWVNSSKLNQESSAAEVEAVGRCNNATYRNIAGSTAYQWPVPDRSGIHDLESNKDAMNGGGHFQEMGAPPSAPPMMRNDVRRVESNLSSTYTDSGRKSCSDEILQENTVFEGAKHNNTFSMSERNKGEPFEARKRDHEGGPSTKQTNVSSQQPLAFTSGYGVWPTVIAYDACVRLCLRAWARGCVEAPEFLNDECVLLRSSFGLEHILLQPHENVLQKPAMDNSEAIAASKRNKDAGKIRVQVWKVRMTMKVSSRCSFPSFDAARASLEFKSDLLAGWESVKKFCLNARRISQGSSSRGATYMEAGAHYMRQVSGLLKAGVSSLRSTTMMDVPEETYSCLLRLKSTAEEEVVRVHPGSGDFHVFHPESASDDLILEVEDSKKNLQGRVSVQLSSISDDQNDRVRWWSLYDERDAECVGKVQLFINYAINSDVSTFNKLGVVSETLAYDTVLEAAMQRQQFGKRNLHLHGSWKWLLSQFAEYYGVSDAYTKLRYLSCIMEVATPTEDCFLLIHDLLYPVVSTRHQVALSRQEKRMLCDVQDQVEQLLALAFENYKSLDEGSPSGISEALTPVSGKAAPAVVPAVQLYTLLHDILSLEAQSTLRTYFQTAAMKRCRRHMAETDEFVSSNNEGFLIDPLTTSGAYSKMKSLCINLSKEVLTDIEIHNEHILPSSIDLPNIATGIYSVELCNRLRAFLVSCPPSSPSQPVIDLLLATADFERDLVSLNIRPLKGGVDAKDLFHLYIVLWIQDKRLNLLDFCKLDKVRCTGVTTQHGTSPFVEEMYERIRETLNEYDVLLSRWPEYTIALENAIADVEAAIIAALEKQYAEVLSPLKDVMVPKKFSFQYVQKLTRRRTVAVYSVPNQLGVFLNTIKRLLDILRPKVEIQMKSWVACLPTDGNERFGERLNEVAVILKTKYKNFLQAIVEKLIDNASMQRTTKLKKILQDTREAGGESEIRDRMQLLNSQLIDTIGHLHDVFSTRVFVAVCRGYWDRMGQDVLHFLETRKENRSWYKGSFYALTILDDLFASQMQKLQGHALQEKDLEPPRSIMEAHSMLSRDAQLESNNSNYLYF